MNAQRRNRKYWEGVLGEKDSEIEHLNERVQALEEEGRSLREECENKRNEIIKLEDSVEAEQEKVDTLSVENTSLKEQVDSFQTKKLADAFEKAGAEYRRDRDKWLRATVSMTMLAFGVSLLYFWYSIQYDIGWESKLNLLTASSVIIYALYFCARQYSLYRNLSIDMKHRQVLAQSYYNVLRSVEDQEIRPLLATKVVEFITTPPHTKEDKMNTPLEIVANTISGGMDKAQ